MADNTAKELVDSRADESQVMDSETPQTPSDTELIRDYVDNKSTASFEALVRRHYNTVHQRLMRLTQNRADADDLSQKLWLRVINNIGNYNDRQKFPNYLNTIASNLLKDEWRKTSAGKQTSLDEIIDQSGDQILLSEQTEVDEQLANQHEISFLTKTLIPNLSVKLRAVFLLRHESEYWDDKQPFQWQHLAELNHLSSQEAGQRFISARDQLVSDNDAPLSEQDQLIFLTWTQAQRQDKSNTQTETYLASLLGIPVNTFKTRYRAALAELSEGLNRWRKQSLK